MKEQFENIIDAISLDWYIEEVETGSYQIGQYSPAGQDFSIVVQSEGQSIEELSKGVYKAYESFDPSSEAYVWLDEQGHGKNGAPHHMIDVYNDMASCKDMVLDLYNSLKKYTNSKEYKLSQAIDRNKKELKAIFNALMKNSIEIDSKVFNPFVDDIGYKDVDPIEYYGDEFINSTMAKLILDYDMTI